MKILRVYFFIFFLFCLTQNSHADTIPAVDTQESAESVLLIPSNSAVSVQQSLEFAFDYSPNLKRLQEARERASHEVRRAQAGYYPTIGIWAGGGFTQEDNPGTRVSDEESDLVGSGNVGLLFSQSLWQGGMTSSLVRSREAGLEASIFDVLDNATVLAYSTLNAHSDLLRRRILVQLARNNVQEHEKTLRLLRTRFSQQLSSRGDVEQVVSRYSRAMAILATYEESLDNAQADYRRITGRHAPVDLLPVPEASWIFDDIETLRNLCVKHNYMLRTQMAQIDAFLGDRDYSRNSFSPHLSFDAGPAYTNTGHKGDNYELTWIAMINLKWNLYNGGADIAGFEAASAQVREAREGLHDMMDMLDQQISIAYSWTETARKQTVYLGDASKASRLARDNFFVQFEAGKKDLLNVLDAETEYFSATVEETVKRTDAVLGQYRMHALAGTLLDLLGIDSEAVSMEKPVRAVSDGASPWGFTKSPQEVDTVFNLKESTLIRE